MRHVYEIYCPTKQSINSYAPFVTLNPSSDLNLLAVNEIIEAEVD